jgi:hypothetical protein
VKYALVIRDKVKLAATSCSYRQSAAAFSNFRQLSLRF